MNNKYIFISLILIGVASLSYLFLTQEKTTEVAPVEEVKEVKVTPEVSYTLDDVKLHKTKTDCWQAIDGIVYDFTPYLESADHPGGNAMAKDCGTDATFRYGNDPEHSDYAKSLLPEYAIGNLVVKK